MNFNVFFIFFTVINISFKSGWCEQCIEDVFGTLEAPQYAGEQFPDRYLSSDSKPTYEDLTFYVAALDKTLSYYATEYNRTDHNRALGCFYAKASLKRTLKDYGDKLDNNLYNTIKGTIYKMETIVSHFLVNPAFTSPEVAPLLKLINKLLADDTAQIYSLDRYRENVMRKYIKAPIVMNEAMKAIDNASLSRDAYIDLMGILNREYYIQIDYSDICLADSALNPIPIKLEKLHRCIPNVCNDLMSASPSVAYTLSHRFHYNTKTVLQDNKGTKFDRQPTRTTHNMNNGKDANLQENIPYAPVPAIYCTPVVFRSYGNFSKRRFHLLNRFVNLQWLRHMRRCYIESPEADALQMELLCSFMYREAVYLARLGYFARDMFIEHIGLCGMLGFEEFFRRHWYYKVISWVDDQGCLKECDSFHIRAEKISPGRKEYLEANSKKLKDIIATKCQNHPMAVMVFMLGAGIRHAAHHATASL